MTEREGGDLSAKQENAPDNNANTASTTTTSSSWSRLKDPRIVRVSRTFGGKDRHSKVCTVRGLRDRRVRLSVPTAIQLYDLQDRLGLNQPSKVVDWLLNVAKQEIDGLPPLQFPVHGFLPSPSAKQGLKISADFNWNDPAPTTSTRVCSGDGNDDHDPYNNFSSSRQQQQNGSSSFSSLLSSTPTMPAPFNSWDPSSLTLSQPPISLGLTPQHDQDFHNFSHLLVYQPTHPYFQPPPNAEPAFHNSDSSAQPARPFRFSMTADLLPSQNNVQNKHDELHSS